MLRECPNCHAKVSTRSVTCPECHGPLRPPAADSAALVFKWAFVTFNLLMAVWVSFYLITGRITLSRPEPASAADAVGTPVVGGMGLGFLMTLWIAGAGILGLVAVFGLAHNPNRSRRIGRKGV